MNSFLPISINIQDKKILIVGGGQVGLQKLKGVTRFTRDVTVLATSILPEVSKYSCSIIQKQYETIDLQGFHLVYACTNSIVLNQQIQQEAHQQKLLVNVADNPSLSDFISPAVFVEEGMSVAISSQGKDVRKSVKWKNTLQSFCIEHFGKK